MQQKDLREKHDPAFEEEAVSRTEGNEQAGDKEENKEKEKTAGKAGNADGGAVLEKLEAELSELKDKYLRQAAEFDNYRKRTAREIVEMNKVAGKDVIVPLLDVIDDCDRAEAQMSRTGEADVIREGSVLIFNKMKNILQAQGLKAMESIGRDFDPDRHEAVAEIPAPDPSMVGKVIDEVQKGYYLNDKIIRFAKVVVGK